MKGLLLKDYYMMMKYCRAAIIASVLFLVLSAFTGGNLFLVIYPVIICSMIPLNLIAYEEQSGWEKYCAGLPYSKAEIVSSKYIIGLVITGIISLCTVIVQTVQSAQEPMELQDYGVTFLVIAMVCLLSTGVLLPPLYKFGVAKGRLIYVVIICILCGGVGFLSAYFSQGEDTAVNFFLLLARIPGGWIVFAGIVFVLVLYALSWWISILIYKRREL